MYDHIYDWLLIPLRLKNTEISNRVPLNRYTKKDSDDLLMTNYFKYDFNEDFKFDEEIANSKKIE
jgi:hypothetical protein